MVNLDALMNRTWFYPFELPDGRTTPTYGDGRLDAIHATRLTMLKAALADRYPDGLGGRRGVDLACHQGYFSFQLLAAGIDSMVAIDARDEHVDDTRAMAAALGHADRMLALQSDVHDLEAGALGPFEVVLNLGLIYHLENPIGALRQARALTAPGGVCLVETQVVPHLSGPVDWGNYEFVKDLKGCFGIIDETFETHGPEASTLGICLAPSTPGLLWILRKIGFDKVALLDPPEGAYEQLRFGKRVMVAAYVET